MIGNGVYKIVVVLQFLDTHRSCAYETTQRPLPLDE